MAREDRQGMTTALSPALLDLESLFEVSAECPNRKMLVQQPGLKVMHLTLAPGQGLPPHRHPDCYVLLQGLRGTITVQLEQEEVSLRPQHFLGFSGETNVSPRNDSDVPSALLITLAKQVSERRGNEDSSVTRNTRVP